MLLGVALAFFFTLSIAIPVSADEPKTLPICPITDAVGATFVFPEKERVISNDSYADSLALSNVSEYTLPNIQILVAFYAPGATKPSHLAVLDEPFTLGPKETTTYPFVFQANSLPAGQYEVEVFASQGGVQEVIGTALLEVPNRQRIKIEKTSAGSDLFEHRFTINGVSSREIQLISEGQPVAISAFTTNVQATPAFSEQYFVSLSRGSVPLGSAVQASSIDNVRLLPGSVRETALQLPFGAGGDYQLTAVMVTPNVISPLSLVQFSIAGEASQPTTFSYLDAVGLGNFVSGQGTELIACLQNTSKDTPISATQLGFSGGGLANFIPVSGSEAQQIIIPEIKEENPITIALLVPKERSRVTSEADSALKASEGYVSVSSVTLNPDCERFSVCYSDDSSNQGLELETDNQTIPSEILLVISAGILCTLLGLLVFLSKRNKVNKEKIIMTKPDNS